MAEIHMITTFMGKPLSDCTNGEIVNALKYSKGGTVKPDVFDAVLTEAVVRKILPDAMWLVST
jgi:hypothetical protein